MAQFLISNRICPFILFLCATLTASAANHRFYAVEAGGDSTATGIEHTIVADSVPGIEYTIVTDSAPGVETVRLTVRNNRHIPFQPLKAGLKLGIDTYMDKYPDWYDKFFPTLAVCEPDHFYGYLQSPNGKIKAVVSADPIASWSLDYNLGYQSPAPHWFFGHRVECLNLDMLCRGPLPAHHPHDQWQLAPGEERTWTVKIIDLDTPEAFEETVYRHTGAPVIDMRSTSCATGDSLVIDIWGTAPEIAVNGNKIWLNKTDTDGMWRGVYRAADPGIKVVQVRDGGRSASGTINVRYPWRSTMELARRAADRYKQKPTSHVESWYGFHTAFDAARIMPEPATDSVLDVRFDMIIDKVFDRKTGEPYKYRSRIQNVSSTIGMLADRYMAYGRKADLDLGERMAAYLMSCQRDDGAYMNGHTDYTSVIYPAKSLLEFADAERAAGRKKQAARYEASARRAIDRLVSVDGNLETEGQMTYEDGMISCSALQLGELALRSKNEADRRRYTEAMLKLLDGHDSLTQLRVPDGRRRGGTHRFWEAQYDVFMLPNMISSPHGWSAWRAYATYYAYLLTGDERWLRETFDAASAFASLIDQNSGALSWAFVVDPYVDALQVCEPDTTHTADDDTYGNPHPECYPNRRITVGEEYVPMIADWQTIVSSDNDVHECFKFIAEAVLCNAFVVERPDGTIAAYNCRAERIPASDGTSAGSLRVTASEPQITTLYTNLRSPLKVEFAGEVKKVQAQKYSVADYNVIPLPQKVEYTSAGGAFTLDGKTVVAVPGGDKSLLRNARMLASALELQTGIRPKVVAKNVRENAIVLTDTLRADNRDAYRMRIDAKLVVIDGASAAGNFYGTQTLRKAIPAEKSDCVTLQAAVITDAPRFGYRGAHFDCVRHFFPLDSVKRYIDIMALHNINRFHWHLTDDQGWRVEIKSRPLLTEKGSVRGGTLVNSLDDKTLIFDSIPYGGYYTQAEIRDLVKYAADRYISVIPEIDLPGHMMAALASYPELGCTGGPYEVRKHWGVSDDLLCAGNDSVYKFLDDVLGEVVDLFPGDIVHIGGDECPKVRWQACPRCQAKIKELGLQTDSTGTAEQKLQIYVMKYAADFLARHGRRVIGWDEILEGGADPSTIVMSWRGPADGGQDGAVAGHDVIKSPNTHLYFDYKQVEGDPIGAPYWRKIPLETVYSYEPLKPEYTPEQGAHVIGVQANLWTEHIRHFYEACYMALPRMAALSELQWSSAPKNYEAFLKRLPRLEKIYEAEGLNYRHY